MTLYSLGECPYCAQAGEVVIVGDMESHYLFFMCPSCGCGWPVPPREEPPMRYDRPNMYARLGIYVPTREEISSKGLGHVIHGTAPEGLWDDALSDYMPGGRELQKFHSELREVLARSIR
jgi:hypothetical protein